MPIHIFFSFSIKKNFEMQKKLLSRHFLFILNVLNVLCLKIMILGEAMALETHFVDSKHDQNVAVSMDIIITGSLPLTRGSVAECLARRIRDLVVAGSIPNQAML